MQNKQLLAVVAVAILVVAGVAVFLSVDQPEQETATDYGGSLLVFGNANGDSVIDEADKTLVQKIIDGDAEKTDLCDANQDGDVNEKDLEQIDNLMAHKDGLTVYYIDGTDLVNSVSWPLDKVGVLYRAQQTCLAAGLEFPQVILFRTGYTDDILYKSMEGAKYIKTGGLKDYDMMISNGIPDALVTVNGDSADKDPAIAALYKKAGIDIIHVANMEGYGSSATVLTLGYLMDTEAEAQKYAAWNTAMLDDIREKVASIPKDKLHTCQMWMGGYFVTGTDHDYTKAMEFAGGVPVCDWTGLKTLNMDERSWFYNYDPDFIIRTMGIGYSAPPEKGPGIYDKWAPVIEEMRACKDGHFCVIDSSVPQSLRSAYIAEFLYPEVFGDGYGDNWHKQLVDVYGIDFEVNGQFVVTAEDMKEFHK